MEDKVYEYKGHQLSEEQYNYTKSRDEEYLLPSNALDVVILTQYENKPYILLNKVDDNKYSLIGSFVKYNKTFDESVEDIVKEKTGLNIRDVSKRQIKTYSHPNRDSRGHIITTLYVMYIPYQEVEGSEWFSVNYSENIYLENSLTISLDQDNNSPYLQFNGIEGHGNMIYDALKELKETIYDKGEYLKVYTNGFTIREAWLFIQHIFNKELARTNQRRLLLKFSKESGTERESGKTSAKVYQLKTKEDYLEELNI